jgi:23S rRNA (adenine2030-N6)-methyltransferase
MNYRHSYHAGNFADVFKHIVLTALLEALLGKDKPFCFIDTHAGVGQYDLRGEPSQKSQEYVTGIEKVWHTYNAPALVNTYLDCVNKLNSADPEKLRYYPGSPMLAQHFMRPDDRMVLTELHADDYALLKQNFSRAKRTSVQHLDGYQALKAFLPPPERRGLVLIDPPYEQPDELMQMIATLCAALERWETGIYALWYPIKEYRATERFLLSIQQRITRPMLCAELSIFPENLATHLNGSGMLIINPPYQLETTLQPALKWLWETLSPDKKGRYGLKMLPQTA